MLDTLAIHLELPLFGGIRAKNFQEFPGLRGIAFVGQNNPEMRAVGSSDAL